MVLLDGNTGMSIDNYRQILTIRPDAFHAAAALADLQIKTGDTERAAITIDTFLKQRPVANAIAFIFPTYASSLAGVRKQFDCSRKFSRNPDSHVTGIGK
jgi:thioredoxin-like negative regulator of GroEL